MTFSFDTRKQTIEKLQTAPLDILVIGGGVTGAGIALEGAAKGLSVGLIEQKDFSSGTSSRSTKLVHGGLRYLKQFEVELVSDITKERAVIGKIAPHVVKPEFMVLPVYDEPEASFTEFSAEIALFLYDYLAEVEEDWGHRFISREELLEEEPKLKEAGLLKGGLYLDYRNDDSRLTVEIIKKAHDLGALIANYTRFVDFNYEGNRITGIQAEDVITKEIFTIEASVVVNATGPWSDNIRSRLKNEEDRMFPTKGVHFVVDYERLPVERTIYTDTGYGDDRMIFIIPRGNKTYFGTSDTEFDINDDLEITSEDIQYLLDAVNYRFPDVRLTVQDLIAGWAGLRPLLQGEDSSDPGGLSRGHEVIESDGGLITIAGGKLTDYRLMAEDTFEVIDRELEHRGLEATPVDTAEISLSGGELPEGMSFEEFKREKIAAGEKLGLEKEDAEYLVNWYGVNIDKVYQYADEPRHSELPKRVLMQINYALDHEMIYTLEDFFDRRTEYLLFYPEKIEGWKNGAADILAERFEWEAEEKAEHLKAFEQTVAETTLKKFK